MMLGFGWTRRPRPRPPLVSRFPDRVSGGVGVQPDGDLLRVSDSLVSGVVVPKKAVIGGGYAICLGSVRDNCWYPRVFHRNARSSGLTVSEGLRLSGNATVQE